MKYQGITIHKSPYANTWYARYRANGKQHFISAKTQKDCYNSLKKALQQAKRTQQVIELNKTSENTPTLLEWYNKWLNLYKTGKVKETTIKDYNKSMTYLTEEIKNKTLDNIKSIEILELLNGVTAERQRQKVYELLYMLFEKANKNEIINKNIIKNIDKPKHEKINSKALTQEQQKELIKVCKNTKHGNYFLICLYQGLRKGECLAITGEDIDLQNKILTINKSINDNNKIDTTKNKQSNRTMPLFSQTIEILKQENLTNERIFNFSPKILKLTLLQINKKLSFHLKTKDLRTTFITRCQELNIPLFIIQSWVGHKIGSKVTASVYTTHNKEVDNKYINILNSSRLYSNYTHKKK